jgi:hypothetical protein
MDGLLDARLRLLPLEESLKFLLQRFIIIRGEMLESFEEPLNEDEKVSDLGSVVEAVGHVGGVDVDALVLQKGNFYTRERFPLPILVHMDPSSRQRGRGSWRHVAS